MGKILWGDGFLWRRDLPTASLPATAYLATCAADAAYSTVLPADIDLRTRLTR
jgi:hypothetical protein